MQHRFCQISNLILAQKSECWYADLHILIERGILTHELSLLLRNDDTETNEENQTGVYHLLLSGVSTYLQRTNWYLFVHGKWCYLYRAIDGDGNLVDSRRSRKARYGCSKTVLEAGHGCGWARS